MTFLASYLVWDSQLSVVYYFSIILIQIIPNGYAMLTLILIDLLVKVFSKKYDTIVLKGIYSAKIGFKSWKLAKSAKFRYGKTKSLYFASKLLLDNESWYYLFITLIKLVILIISWLYGNLL